MMADRRRTMILAGLLLAGCDRPASRDAAAENPLEIAARERGVVRPEASVPTGVFERSHDLGRDAMCVVPDGAGRWRFAVAAAFGPGLSCSAAGQMVRDGDAWLLRFSGPEGCAVAIHEEEDELRLPGALPVQCARLCPDRVSLAGLRLPRASWSEEDARRLRIRDGQGNMLQPCSS